MKEVSHTFYQSDIFYMFDKICIFVILKFYIFTKIILTFFFLVNRVDEYYGKIEKWTLFFSFTQNNNFVIM